MPQLVHGRIRSGSTYSMAERIVVMQDGRIEQIGAPLELYNHPKNVFVATFIGAPAMNR